MLFRSGRTPPVDMFLDIWKQWLFLALVKTMYFWCCVVGVKLSLSWFLLFQNIKNIKHQVWYYLKHEMW